MKDTDHTDTKAAMTATFGTAAKPSVTIDIEKYQHFLDNSGMSPEERRAFLEALWTIITAFVDLGFGVHPLQEVCGQNPQDGDQSAAQGEDGVSCTQTDLSRTFNDTPEAE